MGEAIRKSRVDISAGESIGVVNGAMPSTSDGNADRKTPCFGHFLKLSGNPRHGAALDVVNTVVV